LGTCSTRLCLSTAQTLLFAAGQIQQTVTVPLLTPEWRGYFEAPELFLDFLLKHLNVDLHELLQFLFYLRHDCAQDVQNRARRTKCYPLE